MRGFFALSMQEHAARGLTPEQWRLAAQELYTCMRTGEHWHEGAPCNEGNCPAVREAALAVRREQEAAAERARVAGEEARAWAARPGSTGPRPRAQKGPPS
jgi:hypothetical protein